MKNNEAAVEMEEKQPGPLTVIEDKKPNNPKPQKPKEPFVRRYKRQIDLQLLVIPGLLLILVFNYFPMYGLVMAFQDYDIFAGFWNSEWVGLKHFQRFFQDPKFFEVMRNTVVLSSLK